jgi:hypothetical protein
MIDDVDYMKQHGEIETRIFYIDSNQRSDPRANPNDFTIQFDEPIRNVVGFSVKDSNVPSTSYTIDDHSNIFRLFAMGFDTAATTYVINYAYRYTEIFLNFMTDDSWTNEEDNAETVVVIRDHRAGPLPDMSNMLSISDAPFDFVPALTILGPDDVLPESIQIVTVADGTSGETLRVAYHADDGTGDAQKVVKRVFFFPIGNYTHPAKIVAMAEQGDGPRTALLANDDEVFLVPTSVPVERLGTLDILSRPWSLALGAIDSSSDPSVIAAETGTSIVVFDTTSSIGNVIGFSEAVNEIRVMDRLMSTNMAVGDRLPRAQIRSGNLMNMSGARYIMLRCPQIETSSNIGTGRNSQRGVGLFKLSNPGVIRRETADYVNVLQERFHPIAKLDRLSFRFEREASGELYNFRGVGTLMIIGIDVYVNKKPMPFERSSLNPDYNIDYRQYQADELYKESLIEKEEQDMLPLDKERITRALAEHNTYTNRY